MNAYPALLNIFKRKGEKDIVGVHIVLEKYNK
jgi:hypothetical protein